ncbi:Helix-turn-helix domain-containing protein [Salinihabitans flavidus]|uniref:Helix-turn-helix domain-containing protein n=1 Tax=Salinihabitans flavidus TaxID=569882 RepID=A0A1H8VZR1_9RHOB|nr:helix-turn-helix domain-containing protein [Salinihabitans flavidus]SEP20912.1 Helix-turn-helix domain-containing protein [Salinihabitans flavidus]
MSHAATNWAIQQRGLKPTTKIVLWHLCDRFNPDHGCFPSQERLAHDCEISRSTLNAHIGQLEAAGLVRRVPRIHPVTKRQMPTRYILGFEPGFAPHGADPCPESGHGDQPFEDLGDENGITAPGAHEQPGPCPGTGHGNHPKAVSDFCPDPCPENPQSRVRNPDTNPVREPLSKPVKEEEGAQAREAEFELFFGTLLQVLGLAPDALPGWWQGWPAREHVRRWRDDLGLSADTIIAVAEATRREHPEPPDGPKALDRAMQRAARQRAQPGSASQQGRECTGGRRGRRKAASGPLPSADELAAFYAGLVNSDRYLPANTISNTMRDAMLARGLVTVERLRERGVR